MLYKQVEDRENRHIGGVTTDTGACRFCGQVASRKVLEEWSSEEVDELVTETCDCWRAKDYTHKKEQQERADEKIDMLFGEQADVSLAGAAVDLLHKAVYPICEGCIASMSIDAGNGVKGKISMTAKGGIRVVRTKTDTSAYEA